MLSSLSLAVLATLLTLVVGDQYYIGVGRYDVTGPAVETEMASGKYSQLDYAEWSKCARQ